MPSAADMEVHRIRMDIARRRGEQFLARVRTEKGRALCLACDTTGNDRLECAGHDA